MHDDLVANLRRMSNSEYCAIASAEGFPAMQIIKQAADAIEELSAHYCPHSIRNVHDRGDDSLCRVLMREPPKEET